MTDLLIRCTAVDSKKFQFLSEIVECCLRCAVQCRHHGRALMGLTPQTKLQAPNWNTKCNRSDEFYQFFKGQAPLHKRKASLLTTFWRRFCCSTKCEKNSIERAFRKQPQNFWHSHAKHFHNNLYRALVFCSRRIAQKKIISSLFYN